MRTRERIVDEMLVLAAQRGKTWYWMQHERLALIREVKRVELLVAQLASELRGR